ncbi:hypothetical protein A3I27_03975 [Candidatus Giovannonibacteria bacterium RIFCSPLOWO2_02_FULL_43_11b]|nr:MAG: hypothetical protein A3I27_03975 [Candidatus Giovannonibacteria bacterium RIFCSPLOWO2_02_FULL_43_11b]OGF91499.1 MAG: hypothetical protein A3H04_02085 [Candidatus Giovannonibacteria bacterium RIFCSPLOWO2_12_FULL_43_11c]
MDYLIRGDAFDKVFMVGDSMSDWLDDDRVIQCAVGNASDAYKEKSKLIATSARTEGVIELLELIAK